MPTKTKATERKNAASSAAPDPAEVEKAVRQADEASREVLEFLQAVDKYKRKTNKSFPTWSEILTILKSLGYKKVEE